MILVTSRSGIEYSMPSYKIIPSPAWAYGPMVPASHLNTLTTSLPAINFTCDTILFNTHSTFCWRRNHSNFQCRTSPARRTKQTLSHAALQLSSGLRNMVENMAQILIIPWKLTLTRKYSLIMTQTKFHINRALCSKVSAPTSKPI